jgi:thiamine biosynthesis lipoprotein
MELKRLMWLLVAAAVIVAAVYFVPKGPVEIDGGSRILMGTVAHIIAVAPHAHDAQKGIDSAFAELERIEKLASTHLEDSEISKVNRLASKEPVHISDDIFEILQKAIYYSRLTSGAFDVSVGPLVELWKSAAEANELPSEEQLDSALSKVGFDKIILDANDKTVRFAVEGMEIDLGGIAKGYGIDRAAVALMDAGAVGGMVDVGGDIRCFGAPVGEKHWLIGLQDPNLAAKEQSLLVLKLNDSAVTTSGDYRRFVLVRGARHSHIINTHSGQSAASLSSASVIASKAVDADALATAVSVMGAGEGLKLIESLKDTEAIIVSPAPQYKITATQGARDYIESSASQLTFSP